MPKAVTGSMITLTSSENSTTQLQLPASLDPSARVQLFVIIRDKFESATIFRLPPVQVTTDLSTVNDLLDVSQTTKHPLLQQMNHEDQNVAAPIMQSFIQVMDEIREQKLYLASQSNI